MKNIKTKEIKKNKKILDKISEIDPEFLLLDGYDDCIVGIMERFGIGPIVCYSKDAIIDKLSKDMSYEDVVEFFDFNIIGAWVGEKTPCFVSKII